MTTIIAGSRTCPSYSIVEHAIRASGFNITHVISGGAYGADRFGEQWAARNGIPVTVEPARWRQYHQRAGIIRNERMAGMARQLIACWDGQSRGTAHMVEIAKQKGLKIYVYRF